MEGRKTEGRTETERERDRGMAEKQCINKCSDRKGPINDYGVTGAKRGWGLQLGRRRSK